MRKKKPLVCIVQIELNIIIFMLVKTYIFILTSFLFCSCGNNQAAKENTPAADTVVAGKDGTHVDDKNVSPYDADFARAAEYLQAFKYEEAMDMYEKLAKESDQKALANVGIGNCYLLKQDSEKALKAFEEALKIDPEFYAAFLGIGSCCLTLKRYDRAIEYYTLARNADENVPDSYWGLAIAYDRKNMGDSALVNAKKFMDIEPHSNYAYDMQQIIKKHTGKKP